MRNLEKGRFKLKNQKHSRLWPDSLATFHVSKYTQFPFSQFLNQKGSKLRAQSHGTELIWLSDANGVCRLVPISHFSARALDESKGSCQAENSPFLDSACTVMLVQLSKPFPTSLMEELMQNYVGTLGESQIHAGDQYSTDLPDSSPPCTTCKPSRLRKMNTSGQCKTSHPVSKLHRCKSGVDL